MIYEYDEQERLVKADDRAIYLTNKQNLAFRELYNAKGKIVTYERLNDVINSGYDFGRIESIATLISRLRDMLGDCVEIDNVSGIGYRIKARWINNE